MTMKSGKTRLSVNINKIATLRNARGENVPDLVKVALDCVKYGAHGITVHPRPDERHVKRQDVYLLSEVLPCEFNIEGFPSLDFIKLVNEVRPTQVTLVPDSPDAITSNAGWNVIGNKDFLRNTVNEIRRNGIRVSIFVDPDVSQIKCAAEIGADRVELYTKPYAEAFRSDRSLAIAPYTKASEVAAEFGLGVNAGHDLNLDNLHFLSESLLHLDEVSIGHALISDALYYGLEDTIRKYLECLNY